MNLFFEESGEFRTGSVLAQAGESYQVALPGGKRVKVRSRDVLLQYTVQDPSQLMAEARELANTIDLDFLWEVAGEAEFGFVELGTEYFGHNPEPREFAGLLIRLHSAPAYFYKKGKGRYKAAPRDALKAALAGMEKKRQQAIVQVQYVAQLKEGALPPEMAPLALSLVCKPDKNSTAYKALVQACTELQTTPERLMLQTGGIASPQQLHVSRFLFEHFPEGSELPEQGVTIAIPDLPVADVAAFSVDDVTTTEIDDAFSVTRLPDGNLRVGIHIAVPALGIVRDDAVDKLAKRRLSTVYMPGHKITMLPPDFIRAFTLDEGGVRPALSLYITLNAVDYALISTETRVERIVVRTNMRHNDWDTVVTEESLMSGQGEYPHRDELFLLWQWACVLWRQRMVKRERFGLKPERPNRADYHFHIHPDETVTITPRLRDAPLDRIVSELMIFANSTWGQMMGEQGVPGIFRIQGEGSGGWINRRQVRMVTYPAPHQGLGVDQYAWSTSPLRRYTDLVNQWQILSIVRPDLLASAPFGQQDASLFAIVSAFDSAYAVYGEFQSRMERYWCLRWLSQQPSHQFEAVLTREDGARLADVPLAVTLPASPSLERGTRIKVDILKWDEIDLSVETRLLGVSAAPHEEDGMEPDEDMAE
ncbi:MAG: RNB domain-containing ribonuclease [Burkholderiaceae bacterium]|jgi:exoribonuclease-2|nr:RNB domain-containing ribonuclease [Burkholderiaceae bacterium]